MPPPCLKGVDVVILAGGLGTRISGVLGDTPKILAPIDGRPFLDYLLDWLSGFGASRIILCLGHLADKIIQHVDLRDYENLQIEYLVESAPIGTGGAIREASTVLESDLVMVLNGDTWLDLDLCDFLKVFRNATAGIGLVCAQATDAGRFGQITLTENSYVDGFIEKGASSGAPGLVSSGIYLFSQTALSELRASSAVSLERDFLQKQPVGRILAFQTTKEFIDIGTPESLANASTFMTSGRTRIKDLGR